MNRKHECQCYAEQCPDAGRDVRAHTDEETDT
jgi:hypothetical protein